MAFSGYFDGANAAQKLTSNGIWIGGNFCHGAFGHDFAAVDSCAGAYVDNVIGHANGVFVVFNNKYAVA